MYKSALKRIIDVCCSLILITILSPIFIITTILIGITSGFPILFTQERAGWHGIPFVIYKFRTLKNSDSMTLSAISTRDPRITRIGHFLREWSIDELPQLFNVLKGDMSLVGPRPLPVLYVNRYTPRQFKRLRVRPGMTGLQQITCRYNTPWEKKFTFDIHYVAHYSFGMDLRIILATIKTILIRPSSAVSGGETYEFK